ncbi:MAG: hypothetical protein LQ346_007118 [Caloplaca aetnensis]|nr:MAG: hypothetical protein LQ346_007118 [Caloplaca aetnensis]
MSLQVYIAHTGHCLSSNLRFTTLESLQSWIARNSTVESQDQILMTARGKQVKLQTLSLETEIFVYNRQILSAATQASLSSSLPHTPTPDPYSPETVPEGPRNKDDPEAWRKVFDERKTWAIQLQDRCAAVARQIQQLDGEATVIQRSAAIAVENVKQHIANLRPKFEDSRIWAENVLQDQSFLLEEWERIVGKYPSIPTIKALGICLTGSAGDASSRSSTSESEASLYDFVDIAEVTKASNAGKGSHQRFRSRTVDVNVAFSDVEQKADAIVGNFNRDANLSDSSTAEQSAHLLQEVQVITNKISADHDHVLGLSQGSNAITQMTRIALLHTRSFTPTLLQTVTELDELLRKSVERKNDAQTSGVQYLQNISSVESRIALVHTKLAKLDVDPEDGQAFEVLGAATRLPSIYGLLLVECIRRLEWTDKITVDSSTLVEEVATFKEEEIKRRKKWIRDMEGAVDLGALDEMSFSVDINVQAEKQHWPNLGRENIYAYTSTLRELQGFDEAIREVQAASATLDAPTRQQSRRAKAFKNGSIHDTAFGRNSLLLRGDDEIIHSLKTEKSKLEDKLKSSDSRIRKLEDLLHRQSQASRPSSSHGNAFSIPAQAPRGSSPVIGFAPSVARPHDSESRRSSTSSRRISTHGDSDEKNFGKKIASLEAELVAQKAQSAGLQKDNAARMNAEDDLRAQVREAMSIKEDLLGNYEARQREFEDERRLLEEDNMKLKIRLEEAEDELDQVIGSRDRDAPSHATEEELQRIRGEAEDAIRTANAQREVYRNESESLRAANDQFHEQQTKLQSQLDRQANHMQNHVVAGEMHGAILQSTIEHLGSESKEPMDLGALVHAVETAARKNKADLDELRQLLDQAQLENNDLKSRSQKHEVERKDLRDRLGNEEMEVFSTRESLAEHREQLKQVRIELDMERANHSHSRTEHQNIQARAESLQGRVADLNGEVGTLRLDLEKSHKESRSFHSQMTNHQHLSSERLANRASRAEAISQRLYTHVSRMERLLEQVGYTVTRQQGSPMAVQKVPKAPGTSTFLSSSGPMPTKSPGLDTFTVPDHLSWATSEKPEMEGQLYVRFEEDVSTFDIDIFQEAIVKRIKDAEHLARKWQREARGYRDKFHRAQGEAHEKIAFRSFKEGDLALFLPTRNQATRPWAAFNVGAPHYFLREQDSHKLRSRDWLLARISKVEERVVDLSKSINGVNGSSDRRSIGDASDGASIDDENPFELSDGLRWYLLDAAEEKPGAPINVGLGKATVASASVDARGSSIRPSRKSDGNDGATKTLTRSLDSRRSSTNSKKDKPLVAAPSSVRPGNAAGPDIKGENEVPDAPKQDIPSSNAEERQEDKDEVYKNLLWGP